MCPIVANVFVLILAFALVLEVMYAPFVVDSDHLPEGDATHILRTP